MVAETGLARETVTALIDDMVKDHYSAPVVQDAPRTLDRFLREWLAMHPNGEASPKRLLFAQVTYEGLDGTPYRRQIGADEMAMIDDD